jgi:hypothetical protein
VAAGACGTGAYVAAAASATAAAASYVRTFCHYNFKYWLLEFEELHIFGHTRLSMGQCGLQTIMSCGYLIKIAAFGDAFHLLAQAAIGNGALAQQAASSATA